MHDPRPHHRFRVATYNIRKAVGLDWRRDPGRITTVLAGLNADLVAIQEADRRFGQRHRVLEPSILAATTGLEPVRVGQNGVSLGWHGNAVLVGPRVRIGAVTPVPLRSPDPRGAVLVRIEAPVPMTLVAVHLSLFRGARRRQLAAVRAILEAEGRRPAIVMGDFNAWTARSGTEALAAAFTVLSPGKSFHAAYPLAALDRIAVTREFDVHASGVWRCALAGRASDHLPVWADLAIRGPSAPG